MGTRKQTKDAGRRARKARCPASLQDLVPDAQNARKHGDRNLRAIVSSLQDFGAARSIVIDEKGVILAGNATVEAAVTAGLTKLQVVDVAGDTVVAVRRRGLTASQKARLAVADNRTAELADGWDANVLAELRETGVSFDELFTDQELAKLFAVQKAAKTDAQLGALEYRIIVDCRDDAHQTELLQQFEEGGLTCRALIS